MSQIAREGSNWLYPSLLALAVVLILLLLLPILWRQIWGLWEWSRCALGWHQRVEDSECVVCGERDGEVERWLEMGMREPWEGGGYDYYPDDGR